MSGSYRRVNYALRPAKAIERRMLCSAFERLYPFQRVQSYQYIGFGSIYFSDFQLFHRVLGITDMLSIEKDVEAKKCFVFNKPYRCIKMKFASSTETLPLVNWRKRAIVWLDYDGYLDTEKLSDLSTVCAHIASGSILLISVNAQAESEPDKDTREAYKRKTGKPFDLADFRFRRAKKQLGEKLPAGTTGADLRGEKVAYVLRDVINNLITEQVSVRNFSLRPADKFVYRQLFNFHYKDGARMLTTGGLLYSVADESKFDACRFDELPFIRTEADACNIVAPCLTPKEIRHLNSQLPKQRSSVQNLKVPGVPVSDIEKYAEVYRYFPNFSEVLFS